MNRLRHGRRALGFLCLSGLAAAVSSEAAPITFNTALPVAEGEGIFRAQGKYLRATDDPSPMNRELEVWVVPLVGVYGVTADLALFGVVPVLDKELEVTAPPGRRQRADSGLGDVTVFARYTAYQHDRPGETLRLAPFVGIETPTGEDDERDALGRLPQPLQLGSGSWDPFAGVVGTWQTLNRQVDVEAAYTFNTEANDFEFGDQFRFNASYQHRLWPPQLEQGVPAFVYAVLESNFVWRDRNAIEGRDDDDSGGTTWYLTPGLQYVTKRFVAEGAVQLPVVQNLNGDALENDLIVTVGFRVNF